MIFRIGRTAVKIGFASLCLSGMVSAAVDEPAQEGVHIAQRVSSTVVVGKVRVGADVAGLITRGGAAESRKSTRVAQLLEMLERSGVTKVALSIDPPAKGANVAARVGLDRFYSLVSAEPQDTLALAAKLQAEFGDLFEAVEADGLADWHVGPPNDPRYANQWYLSNSGQTTDCGPGVAGADVRWLAALSAAGTPLPVVVAVLDTGVSMSHPDLLGQLVQGRNTSTTSTNPAVYLNTDDVNMNAEPGSHGTKCAGVIAAVANNGVGIAGVAPNAKIMPIKIAAAPFAQASTTSSANGVTWAVDLNAQVLSMSWGFPSGSTNLALLQAAIQYAAQHNVVMVASTGNVPGQPIGYPAADAEVIAVGSTTNRDEFAPFTSTGAAMDIAAPGDCIYTTVDQLNNPNGYGDQTGTSFSVPMVAGVAALVWGVNPSLTGADVRSIIVQSVDDLGSAGYDAQFGAGRLNAYAAVRESLARLPSCAVDFNSNRTADIGDLFYYVDLYFQFFSQSGNVGFADFSRDGYVDVGDLFAFMDAWFRGC